MLSQVRNQATRNDYDETCVAMLHGARRPWSGQPSPVYPAHLSFSARPCQAGPGTGQHHQTPGLQAQAHGADGPGHPAANWPATLLAKDEVGGKGHKHLKLLSCRHMETILLPAFPLVNTKTVLILLCPGPNRHTAEQGGGTPTSPIFPLCFQWCHMMPNSYDNTVSNPLASS